MMMSRQIGSEAEIKARAFLETQGLVWQASNYSWQGGEIDLIMCDQETYVFVEVKSRRSHQFGGALASITLAKQQKIIKTATHFLVYKKLWEKCPVRFDVVCIEGKMAQIQWLKHAFQ
tara:strand:+ start:614 stop:967 length:354 start_codon:yes stop_codon:yes gene_type:complete